MLKLIYDRYVKAGGEKSFDDFQNPHANIIGVAYIDDHPSIIVWGEELTRLKVKKPTQEELQVANSGI